MSLARSARVPPRAIPQPTKSSRTASSQLPTAPSQEMPQTAILRYTVLGLVVRVVAAWFGMFRYSRWIRPAYILTDWIVEPVRRIVPLVGAFDFSPVVAMIVLSLLRQILLSALSR